MPARSFKVHYPVDGQFIVPAVKDSAGPRQIHGVFDVPDIAVAARNMRALIEGTFLQWLQTDDWMQTHRVWKDECREAALRLLGAEEGRAG